MRASRALGLLRVLRPVHGPQPATCLPATGLHIPAGGRPGLSNKDIAATQVVSQRTAESHVEHILTKLGFANHAQVAAWVTAQPHNQDS